MVTGGAHGLGRVMVEALVGANATVLIFDVNGPLMSDVCTAIGGDVHGYEGDVTNESDVEETVAACIDRFGHLDVVVNNAGMTLRTIPEQGEGETRFFDFTPDTFRQFLEAHVIGTFQVARTAVGQMIDQGWGRIISVTTSLDSMTRAGQVPYGPAKAAMESLTSVIAHDLDGTGVTANVLVPGGSVNTHGRASRPLGERPFIPAQVMGPPVVWLASKASDGVTARRFSANRWDPAIPLAQSVSDAGAPIAWPSDRNS
jgi:3-oxoacyl-[acyl-carrier protein] reductase